MENDSSSTSVHDFVMPSDSGKRLVELLWQQGDNPFVCGVNGMITRDCIESIEKEMAENPEWCDELFGNGDGYYLFDAKWEQAEHDAYGQVVNPGYWDLSLVGFREL